MSLSDYSSDDCLDEEPPLGVEVIKNVAKSATTGIPSSMNSSSRSVVTTALAGVAVAGIAAALFALRRHLAAAKQGGKGATGKASTKDKADAADRKELRRKRPVGGDVPRQAAPFMTRTESTSSVGPLRKQPRRETSEDSEGGDAAPASPKGGTAGGHRRSLRKTCSANGRHRRPPGRGAAPRGTSPPGTGSESEGTWTAYPASAKQEAAEPASAAASGPSAKAEAGSSAKAVPEKAAPSAPSDLVAKQRGSPHPQLESSPPAEPAAPAAAAPSAEDAAASAAKTVPEKAAPSAQSDLMAKHRGSAQPAPANENPAPVADASSSSRLSPPPQETSKATAQAGSGGVPKNASLPDLAAPTFIPSMQPSLDTFTADNDVLKQAIDTAAQKEPAPKPHAKDGKSEPDARKTKADKAATEKGAQKDEPGAEPSSKGEEKRKGAAKGSEAATGRSVSKEGSSKGAAAELNGHSAKEIASEAKEGISAADAEPERDLVAAAQAGIDAEDDEHKDLVSPAVAETAAAPAQAAPAQGTAPASGGSAEGGKAAAEGAGNEGAAGKEAGPGEKDQAAQAKALPSSAKKVAAALAGAGGAAAAAAGGSSRAGSRALSSEPPLLPDAQELAAAEEGAPNEQAQLDLSSAEADTVGHAVQEAVDEPADDGDAATPADSEKTKAGRADHKQAQGEMAEQTEQRSRAGPAAGEEEEAAVQQEEIVSWEQRDSASAQEAEAGTQSSADAAHSETEQDKKFAGPEPSAAAEEEEPAAEGNTPDESASVAGAAKDDAAAEAVASFDPLGMDALDEPVPAAGGEAGNGHAQPKEGGEDGQVAVQPQNQAESNVELNLAVAMRIISEKGNLAAAERTLQKSLAAVKDGGGGNVVRPHLRCQLAGTLADIIARSEQAAGSTGKPRPEAAGRLTEIVDLLRFAFEAAKETGDEALRARESWRLGAALAEAEKFEAAHTLFQDELAHFEKTFGAADARTQHSRTWLADVLVKLGRKDEAYKLLADAAEALEKEAKQAASSKPEEPGSSSRNGADAAKGDAAVPGSDLSPAELASVSAAKCYVHIATIQDKEQEHEAAVGNALKAVAVMEATFGEGHPRNSTAYGSLAAFLKHEGKEEGLREALGLYQKLQGIAEAVHGLRNSHTAMAHRAIADVHSMLHEHDEAIVHTEKAVQVASAVHGRDHPVMESYWQAVAEAKQAAGDKDGAKDANRQALRVRSHAQRGGHAGGGGGGRGPRGGGQGSSGAAAGSRRGRGRGRR